MTTRAELDAWREDLNQYFLRMSEWLGLDPSRVMHMKEALSPTEGPCEPPPDLYITWKSVDQPHEADESRWRHRLPMSARGDADGTLFCNGVCLAWPEVERLRAEVGEKPEMPAPPAGWDALRARLA